LVWAAEMQPFRNQLSLTHEASFIVRNPSNGHIMFRTAAILIASTTCANGDDMARA